MLINYKLGSLKISNNHLIIYPTHVNLNYASNFLYNMIKTFFNTFINGFKHTFKLTMLATHLTFLSFCFTATILCRYSIIIMPIYLLSRLTAWIILVYCMGFDNHTFFENFRELDKYLLSPWFSALYYGFIIHIICIPFVANFVSHFSYFTGFVNICKNCYNLDGNGIINIFKTKLVTLYPESDRNLIFDNLITQDQKRHFSGKNITKEVVKGTAEGLKRSASDVISPIKKAWNEPFEGTAQLVHKVVNFIGATVAGGYVANKIVQGKDIVVNTVSPQWKKLDISLEKRAEELLINKDNGPQSPRTGYRSFFDNFETGTVIKTSNDNNTTKMDYENLIGDLVQFFDNYELESIHNCVGHIGWYNIFIFFCNFASFISIFYSVNKSYNEFKKNVTLILLFYSFLFIFGVIFAFNFWHSIYDTVLTLSNNHVTYQVHCNFLDSFKYLIDSIHSSIILVIKPFL